MTIPPVYIASALAVLVLIIVIIKLFKRQHNQYEFVDIEDDSNHTDTKPPLPDLISIYLVPTDPIPGEKLLQFFLNHRLQFNEAQKIFHAISPNGKQFHIATLSSPGTFDIHTMPDKTFTGLSFFMQPNQSTLPLEDFDTLCKILFEAKETFHAHLQNDHKEDISLDDLRIIREQLTQHHD